MSNHEQLILLIEKAGAIAGSEYKLAKAMGIDQQTISGWKAGRRTCTPEDRARLAGFAREDAVQELIRATLEKTAGTLRGEQLYKLLGKSLQATGGATVSALLGVASLTYGTKLLCTMYRKVKFRTPLDSMKRLYRQSRFFYAQTARKGLSGSGSVQSQ